MSASSWFFLISHSLAFTLSAVSLFGHWLTEPFLCSTLALVLVAYYSWERVKQQSDKIKITYISLIGRIKMADRARNSSSIEMDTWVHISQNVEVISFILVTRFSHRTHTHTHKIRWESSDSPQLFNKLICLSAQNMHVFHSPIKLPSSVQWCAHFLHSIGWKEWRLFFISIDVLIIIQCNAIAH